jgi:hypothetical protein
VTIEYGKYKATQTQTRSCRAEQFYKPKDIPFYSMGFSRKRQPILGGLAKVCATLAPNMQFYFYRIDRQVMGTKWSRALALLLHKEEWGLLEGLVLEVLEERLWYSVT